jgi:threonyl-tRNA synthetase
MDALDHRSLGAKLDLWHIQDDAPGMVFWHPRGHAIYRALEDFIRCKMRRLGYAEVKTPQLMPHELWVRSGHWEKFGENMFCVDDGAHPMALKPMSCPCHIQIFNKGLHSRRDLPIRYSELGACHRNEPSGALHGLMRTRAFEQDDAHVFCREDHPEAEVARFIGLLSQAYIELGFPEYEVALSTRPAVRARSDKMWDWAEENLGQAAHACGLSFSIQSGEGAFYGPKLEFHLHDRLGRSWQCGTVQLDCVLPGRLGASYVAADGGRAVPLMIHHAVLGSLGRFVAILLEHYGGVLPFWLSAEQVAVAPISREQADYATDVFEAFQSAGLRVVLYDGAETLSRRIVAAREAAIPVFAIAGQQEKMRRAVTLRERNGTQSVASLPDAVAALSARR